jgi:hypothetical protein
MIRGGRSVDGAGGDGSRAAPRAALSGAGDSENIDRGGISGAAGPDAMPMPDLSQRK